MSREALFQDKLRDLILHVSRRFKFDGLEVARVERDFPIDVKKVDIAVFLRGRLPFLFIETKRETRDRSVRLFDPLSPAVVGQAISYAYLYKERGYEVPYFATANPNSIAVFRTPPNLGEFVRPDRIRTRKYEEVFKPGKLEQINVEQLIEAVEHGKKIKGIYMKRIKQGDMPRDKKWLNIFYGIEKIFESPLLVKTSEYFEVSR